MSTADATGCVCIQDCLGVRGMLYLYLEVILRKNTWPSILDLYHYKLFLIYIRYKSKKN